MELGIQDVIVISPACIDSYEGFGKYANEFFRTAWRAVVVSDILRKLLLKTRPYELEIGTTDREFHECLEQMCQPLSERNISHKQRLKNLISVLTHIRDKFRKIPTNYNKEKPLIGVVGDIFCRLDDFSNHFLVKKIEEYGGEVWMCNMAGLFWYFNEDQRRDLIRNGKRFSMQMLGAKLKFSLQKSDELTLYEPFKEDFRGYEEPQHIRQVLHNSEPYLPSNCTLGEMVLTIGISIYMYKKGVDGVVDISPFTCMQGIVCEAVYPELSRDHDYFPIRTFYFDETQPGLDRDVGIFIELAKSYQRIKKVKRIYPGYFN
jgi:predicted nucleotide-binding protein (sugar kinase/HSP70/actin superfamily)